ncbi:PfkB family carbohydrate kinase [Paenibacillus sp. CC-CFT747]|nr:PfkB family carbohydrate kinase [Paenibacillus sp. CC-CFT747]
MKGTTGAGDCTIAGFLGGMLKGLSLEDALLRAVAVGACNVEETDALSGIPPWECVNERLAGAWPQLPSVIRLEGWRYQQELLLYRSPLDAGQVKDLK